jgi:hypothetical protein
MPEINDYRDSFSRRLDQLREQQQPGASGSANPSDLAGRIHGWDDELQQRLAEFQQASSAALSFSAQAASPAQPDAAEAAPIPGSSPCAGWVLQLDKMMFDELEFGRYALPAGFAAPVHWVDTMAELRKVVALACGVPAIAEAAFTNNMFHYPGRGTFINRAHYEQPGLSDKKRLRAGFIGDIAWERWGWGFMLEYTALGNASGAAGLWPALCAHRLGLAIPDQAALQRAVALRRSWLFLEAGWTEWVWQFVQYKARYAVDLNKESLPRSARLMELLERIVKLFPLFITPFGVRIQVLGLLDLAKFLFFEETDILTNNLHRGLFALQKFCSENDAQVEQSVGARLSQILGRLYFSQLESAAGILATPYAVLIAMHIPTLPGKGNGQQILDAVEQDVRLSADTRLALLARSDARVKYDPRALFVSAWERYQLEGPREFFK